MKFYLWGKIVNNIKRNDTPCRPSASVKKKQRDSYYRFEFGFKYTRFIKLRITAIYK